MLIMIPIHLYICLVEGDGAKDEAADAADAVNDNNILEYVK